MKRSVKAALLSGLVFPGIGHLLLGKYFRGSALLITSLITLSVVVVRAYQHAMLIVDQIISGDVPMETSAITQAVSTSTSTADSLIDNIAVMVLAACWLAGIIDSYRLGAAQEKQDMGSPATDQEQPYS